MKDIGYGAKVAAARRAKGLSQAALAKKCGTSQAMVAYIERRETYRGKFAKKLFKALGVQP